jgi:hypothetical protein
MRSLFSSIVAVSLLVHAAFGCCWHHVHETAGTCGAETGHALAIESAHEHNDCLSGCESHNCTSPHSHGKDHANCQGVCQYLPVQKTQLDRVYTIASLDFALVTPVTIDVQTIALANIAPALTEPAQPPVRLHLFQQLLLI